MGRKSKYTLEERVNAVLDYKSGKRGKSQICNDLGLCRSGMDLYRWVKIYDKYGESGFLSKQRNNSYSKEFKEKVVTAYFNGEGSTNDLTIKYDIPSSKTLRNWILSYNSHIELKDYYPQGDVYMTKSRKTIWKERIEIVEYCINHDK